MAIIRGNPREQWRDIPNIDNYQVSNLGNVRRKETKYWSTHRNGKKFLNRYLARDIKPWDNGKGYKMFGICLKPSRKIEYVHRAVAKAFVPNPKNLPEINHKNGVKSDNRAENIEWCNRSLNMKHARETGLHINQGQGVSWAKLTNKDVRRIKMALETGIQQKELAEIFGVSKTTICSIWKGGRWGHLKLNLV